MNERMSEFLESYVNDVTAKHDVSISGAHVRWPVRIRYQKADYFSSLLWEGGQVAIWELRRLPSGLSTIRSDSEILLSDILENCRFACGSYFHPVPRLRAPVKLGFLACGN
ncbi:hypothetical protein TWF225_004443 [Orbilia oligospora]|nr:hypothetical protein TWF225_004443 [Orbilia oligospora]KAF3241089.1 hypothetical protein TWF217_000648 [Orbilia oligospora]KAF3243466.1 hypothetical protein TWF128_010191 [Orbilia oligospora]